MRTNQKNNRYAAAMRVTAACIAVGILLAAFKFIAAILGNSAALLSDAVDSAADVLAAGVLLWGVHAASKSADKNHPYGHERLESVAEIMLSVLMLGAGVALCVGAVNSLVEIVNAPQQTDAPGVIALIGAAVSIAVKCGLAVVCRMFGKRLNSGALKSGGLNYFMDTFASLGSLAGIVGARLGVAVLDPIAALCICVLIGRAAVSVFLGAVRKLSDEACDEQTSAEICSEILRQDGVLGVDEFKTRKFGDRVYVDCAVFLDETVSFVDAHALSDRIHAALEQKFPVIKHVEVHGHPAAPGMLCVHGNSAAGCQRFSSQETDDAAENDVNVEDETV